MASYVDNSFRQAVMMNPAERTQQVRKTNLLHALNLYDKVAISAMFVTFIHCILSFRETM